MRDEQAAGPSSVAEDAATSPVTPAVPAFSVMGRSYRLPQSRAQRIAIGVALVMFGLLGFLPVLGFWMVPLGLLVLSYEFASVRRARRRAVVWWHRRRQPGGGERPPPE